MRRFDSVYKIASYNQPREFSILSGNLSEHETPTRARCLLGEMEPINSDRKDMGWYGMVSPPGTIPIPVPRAMVYYAVWSVRNPIPFAWDGMPPPGVPYHFMVLVPMKWDIPWDIPYLSDHYL